ncbi:MAG: hypothetical protein CM15mP23_03420 [Cryomorphaceae bacterium]|nr:MAG: hypothetical protein CM15mP23_03420 [Cryomorphaceae bacterium]
MPYILKNKNFEILIDLPNENYNFSRFDWTGKIVKVKFQNILISGNERTDINKENSLGKGFYNEFGINNGLGFDEVKNGEWFHKIGVGALKKEGDKYLFHKNYEKRPAEFNNIIESNRVLITCKSEYLNGYSYILKKEIELCENKFKVKYNLENTGQKVILTNEYNHNFILVNKNLLERDLILKFPFQLNPASFDENVNPEQKVDIGQNEIKFNSNPNEPYFFSNLSGNKTIEATWELINIPKKIIIRETGNFMTNKVNLWGNKHVISPELFINLNIMPGESFKWNRTYSVRNLEMFKPKLS